MTQAAYQPSMLDLTDAAPTLGPLPGPIRRHHLSRGAWVDHLPGWVRGSDAVLDTLLAEVPWRAERRTMYDSEVDVPRLLCWYGGDRQLPHPVLTSARAALTRHYAPSWASRSSPPVCASTGPGATAWPGTATPSAAPRTATPSSRSSRSGHLGRCCCARAAVATACGSRWATAI